MKRNLLQLLVILTFVSVLRAQDLGKVIIRNASPNSPKFIASLNGVRLTNDYNSTLTFDFLDEKNYKVKILQAGSGNVLNFMLNSAPNYVSKYILNKDNYGNFSLILESKALMNGENEVSIQTITPTPDATLSVVPPATVVTAMADTDYNDMLKSVKKESMESTKLEMAKTFFGTQHLSSAQVLGVLKVFSLESSKVSFAKFIYPRTTDKQNYYKVYDAFNVSSSKREISEYIKSNP